GCALLFLVSGEAAPAQGRRVLPGHVPPEAARMVPFDLLPASERLNLAISLPLRNQAALETLLHELYAPASTNFDQCLTPEKFTETFGATEQDYQAVADFAVSHGLKITVKHPNRLVL